MYVRPQIIASFNAGDLLGDAFGAPINRSIFHI